MCLLMVERVGVLVFVCIRELVCKWLRVYVS